MSSTASNSGARHEWLALLCADLPLVRDLATASGPMARHELDELLSKAVRGDVDDAWVARLIELLRRLGVPATPTVRSRPLMHGGVGGLPAIGEGSPSIDCHACPRDLCNRRQVRRPGAPVPRCHLLGAALRAVEEER